MKRSSVRPSACPSICLSHHSTTAMVCGGFAAERRAGRKYRSSAAATGRPAAVGVAARRSAANASSVTLAAVFLISLVSWLRRLNTDLLLLVHRRETVRMGTLSRSSSLYQCNCLCTNLVLSWYDSRVRGNELNQLSVKYWLEYLASIV